jgi:leucyl-tRNA synthetase
MKRYSPKDIESKWQKYWDEHQTYKADLDSKKQKYFAMSMFNYPSGAGIHIGHAMNYTISDVMARFKRQQGYESYHPVGWDAFGLPAENYAIKSGVSPQASMAKIIPDYHKQYKAMGWSNDWSKEISTHEPEYYKWTQWIFSEMYRNDLAYQDARMQWWCDIDKTVLSNEQVIDGKCWRHDGPDDPLVEKKEIKQWFFKITDYAEELLEATDALDWTETVKTAQKNWIGKSKGAEIEFAIANSEGRGQRADLSVLSARQAEGREDKITVFTTRPDTIYGATFLVLAPEHELVSKLTVEAKKSKVESYIKAATKKTEVERQASKEKTGVFTGSYAINPANQEKIPIWIADYVLVGYGTGAIMAVPAHDERDNEFAKKFDLPIIPVVVREHIDITHPTVLGKPVEKRLVAQIIVKHPTEDKYLMLRLKGWEIETYSLPIGGIDEGEDAVLAAMRELQEETGFIDYGTVSAVGVPYFAEFYHDLKKVNRRAYIHTFYTQLKSTKQEKIAAEEQAKHELQWVGIDELHDKLHGQGVQEVVDMFRNGNGASSGEGIMVNSGHYDGLTSPEAREKIIADLTKQKLATEKTIYKLRDWSVSRQRYWGAPIPIIHCKDCGEVLVPDDQLPVVLPELTDFVSSGDGRSALARATDWLNVECPKCKGPAERETDTLDTYICSSWYMLRYTDPDNSHEPFDKLRASKWMPVDFYNGADHATAHMIYARFVTHFFHKLGLVDNPEPFKKFLFNGKVTAADGQMFSKSKGNGVDPLEIINSGYGADALRTYLMFAAPLDLWVRWDPQGVPGAYRFINRVWNLTQEFLGEPASKQVSKSASSEKGVAVLRVVHPAIRKVTDDLENQKYNTAIATLMKAINDLYELKAKDGFSDTKSWQFALESLVMLIGPFAPHAAEQLWHDLGHEDSIHKDHWPLWDDKYLVSDTLTIAVQVNGKLRGTVEVPADASKEAIITAAQTDEKIKAHLNGEPKKTIYVPGKLVNLVI